MSTDSLGGFEYDNGDYLITGISARKPTSLDVG